MQRLVWPSAVCRWMDEEKVAKTAEQHQLVQVEYWLDGSRMETGRRANACQQSDVQQVNFRLAWLGGSGGFADGLLFECRDSWKETKRHFAILRP